ncbi:MAG: beta-ketoacyl synthase N-terminal-like domain-containing protein [Desulfobulbaceae bacterium]
MSDFSENDIEQIAVIGMAVRFPGADTVEQFWQNLKHGKHSITSFSDEELYNRGVREEEYSSADYVKAGVILDNIDLFDADFFGYNAKDAESIDPQQRIFLEVAWEALENAGCNPATSKGSVGVFAGTGSSDYGKRIAASLGGVTSGFDSFQAMLGNDVDFLATRVSYKLNLTGPSFSLQTACSTSLVAVHVACQHLLTYQCDVALAGGVSIRLPQGIGYTYRDGMIWSPDGFCRAFDAKAQGTIFGRGAGIVVLKRLSEALADRDCIHAVIKGSAINNDGALKVGYTAPSVEGQSQVIAMAQALSDTPPDSISYIEAHGTGTKLGDPIEVEALTKAFRSGTDKTGFCGIGSVKTNIGHLDVAAGIAGFIKTVLALKHKEIPPSLHFEQPNPNINFKDSPFYVVDHLQPWKSGATPRRAGVSAFGIGGSNAHVILEEAPSEPPEAQSRSSQLLLLSAKSPTSLQLLSTSLSHYFRNNPGLPLADAAYTLATGRKHFGYRRIAVCENGLQAAEVLSSEEMNSLDSSAVAGGSDNIVFMFSGQGSQYINMCRGLYEEEPLFREQVDLCAEILRAHLKLDLRDILFPAEESEEAKQLINQTYITQPALFVIEYSLARLLMNWGLIPKAMVGHSIGEYVAACLAGVFTLQDALSLVAARGRMMQDLEPGSMLAVPLPEEELVPILPQELSIAVINAPRMTVISGQTTLIEAFEEQLLTEKGLECRLLHTSHAFHSSMMEPIVDQFTQLVTSIYRSKPEIPFVSNVSGRWITDEEAISAEYWARHLRRAVRFYSCMSTLMDENRRVFLEVGPSQVLTMLAKQHPKNNNHVVFACTRRPVERKKDLSVLLTTLGQLWTAGLEVDWKVLYQDESRRKKPLPGYPFERKRYWINAPSAIEINEQKNKPLPLRPRGSSQLLAKTKSYIVTNNNQQTQIVTDIKNIISFSTGIAEKDLEDESTFSDYGIDSLQLTVIASKLKDHFMIPILFRNLSNDTPNIKTLSQHIQKLLSQNIIKQSPLPSSQLPHDNPSDNQPKNLIAIQPKGDKIPFILVHGDEADHLLPEYFDNDQPLWGYLHQGADGEPMRYKKVEDIANFYIGQLLEEKPNGPYILCGFSFGGLVAYEMARILINRGQDVPLLIMLDTFNPSYLLPIELRRKIRNIIKHPLQVIKNIWIDISCRYYLSRGIPIPVNFRNHYILSIYNWTGIFLYKPKPISCPVLLLKAQDTDYLNPTNGWAELVGNNLITELVPGNHLSMLRAHDNFKSFAKIVVKYVNLLKNNPI